MGKSLSYYRVAKVLNNLYITAIRKIHGTDSKDCAEGDLECNLQYIYDNYNANPNANSYNTYDGNFFHVLCSCVLTK